ncbi:MAG: undecaprenyl-diphosphate phosphatase [Brevinema sp.]
MPIIALIVLAVIQGLTEFLPVSSSGHLVMISSFFHLPQNEEMILYYVLVHAGTACAAVFFFRKDIIHILLGTKDLLTAKKTLKAMFALKWIGLVVMVTIPTVFVGLLLRKQIASLSFPMLVPMGLLITAGVLLWSQTRSQEKKGLGLGSFPLASAFLVGVAQSCALLPGISRSGSTIAVALLLGAKPVFAGKLSFLASMTAIFGALLLEIVSVVKTGVLPPMQFAIGFVVAFIVGVLSLGFLMLILRSRKLYYFACYCIVVALAFTGYLIIKI